MSWTEVMKKFTKPILLLIIFIVTNAVGCSSQKIDPLLEGNSECSPPCWVSITPGLTTKSEADDIAIKLEGKQNYSSGENDIYVEYAGKQIHIYSNDADKIVTEIDSDLVGTSLEQLISKFGNPEYLSIMLDQGCVFIIYYPDKGVNFLGQCKKAGLAENGWTVSPSSTVTRAFFTRPGLKITDLLILFFDETSKEMMDAINLWKGYGTYQ